MKKEGIINLETADSNFPVPKHVVEAIKKALEEGISGHYPFPFKGLLELREAIAQDIENRTGVKYDPQSEVLVTSGAEEAIHCAVQAVVNPDDEVIFPDPTYDYSWSLVRLAGGIPIHVSLIEEGWKLDIEELKRKITQRTKLIMLTSPNNPTGSIFTMEELEAVADLARKYEIPVLFDSAFDKIVYDENKCHNVIEIPGMKEGTLLIGSVSKNYAMGGYRVGWLCGPSDIIFQISTKIHNYIVVCANRLGQVAAIAALRGPQDFLNQWIKSYKRRRDILVDGLNNIENITCQKPSGGFFAFPNISRLEKDSIKFSKFLFENAGLSTSPGVEWGKNGEGHIRIVYGQVSEEGVKESIDRLEDAVKAYKKQV